MSKLVLDLGCGSGREYDFNPFFAPILVNALLSDLDHPARWVREHPLYRLYMGWVVQDAHYLALRSECVDAVALRHVLEHCEDPRKVLAEIHRVLKRGGEVIVQVPNWCSVNARADPHHRHVFTPIKLYRLLREIGYVIELPHLLTDKLPKFIRKYLTLAIIHLTEDLVMMGRKR